MRTFPKFISVLLMTIFLNMALFISFGNGQSSSFAWCPYCAGGCGGYAAPGDTIDCRAEGCFCLCEIEWFDDGPQSALVYSGCY